MKLNKEECLIAFNGWKKASKIGLIDVVDQEILLQLIDEHFDNPPLTKSELKELIGQPIWDNEEKKYRLLHEVSNFIYFALSDCTNIGIPFKEGLFYRKQVEE